MAEMTSSDIISTFTNVAGIKDTDLVMFARSTGENQEGAKMLASLFRQYLCRGVQPYIGEDGTWWSNGQQLTDPTTGDPIVANQNTFLTKDEYDALEASGKLQSGVFYFIEEE